MVIDTSTGEFTSHNAFLGHGTNQIAEIVAATEGLKRTPPDAVVELVCDSQYVLKGLTEWRAGWERNGFQNAKKQPVANLPLWKSLFAAADARVIKTRWVKGHSGDKFNEMADAMATQSLVMGKNSVQRKEALHE